MFSKSIPEPKSTPLPAQLFNRSVPQSATQSTASTPSHNLIQQRSISEANTPIKRMILGGKTSLTLTTKYALTKEEIDEMNEIQQKLSRQPSFDIRPTVPPEDDYLSLDSMDSIEEIKDEIIDNSMIINNYDPSKQTNQLQQTREILTPPNEENKENTIENQIVHQNSGDIQQEENGSSLTTEDADDSETLTPLNNLNMSKSKTTEIINDDYPQKRAIGKTVFIRTLPQKNASASQKQYAHFSSHNSSPLGHSHPMNIRSPRSNGSDEMNASSLGNVTFEESYDSNQASSCGTSHARSKTFLIGNYNQRKLQGLHLILPPGRLLRNIL